MLLARRKHSEVHVHWPNAFCLHPTPRHYLRSMSENVIGLDIGGANLKAATSGGQARTSPFELWKHPDQLGDALLALLHGWPLGRLAVTMTGELCDCYETKRDGVSRILAQVGKAFPSSTIKVWSTSGRFVSTTEAMQNPIEVAAANWHALATYLARRYRNGLMIDIGSTTSDIIALHEGKPLAEGLTDAARLESKELVYTGVKRTPICALVNEGVTAEFFATIQDAYLALGMTPGDPNDLTTADARPATKKFAHARLARMLGGDGETITDADTKKLASQAVDRQRSMLANAIRTVVGRFPTKLDRIICSGSGEFLALEAWNAYAGDDEEVQLNFVSDLNGETISTVATAFTVSLLGEQFWTT